MTISPFLTDRLTKACAGANARVLGLDLLKNDAEARLLLAMILAYGDEPQAFLYVSPTRARARRRPPDLVLCHPATGLLVVECKGHRLDEIEGIEAGFLKVRYANRIEPVNVIRQSEDQLYDLQHEIGGLLPDRRQGPLLNALIAFPNIAEQEWRMRGYHELHPTDLLLFAEELADPQRLRAQIRALVTATLALARQEQPLRPVHWEAIGKVFGNSDVINPVRAPRATVAEQQLGGYLDDLLSSESYLSDEQKELVNLRVDGFPRLIRGVAGSGKTVVLAELVARYLQRRGNIPLPHVGVTCFNRTLVPFLRQKIEVAWRGHGHTAAEPLPSLTTQHLNGLLWSLKAAGWPLQYIGVNQLPDATPRALAYRAQIAAFAQVQPAHYHALCFDALFVDEAQDFEPAELALLSDLVKPDSVTGEKTLVLCYDDAQNLYGRTRPVWREIGLNVAIGDRSRVMRRCFRNSRQTVELAFNVLLGSHAPADLRVHTRQYADVGYLREHNLVAEADGYFQVHFAERNGERPMVQSFATRHQEQAWIVGQLAHLIQEEAVRPEDILLIADQPRSVSLDLPALLAQLQQRLPELAIHHAYGDRANKDDYLFTEHQLTIASVYSAKGYDAPIVFLLGADLFPYTKEGRAAFYVAATRAKYRLVITGLWRDRSLLVEAQALHALPPV